MMEVILGLEDGIESETRTEIYQRVVLIPEEDFKLMAMVIMGNLVATALNFHRTFNWTWTRCVDEGWHRQKHTTHVKWVHDAHIVFSIVNEKVERKVGFKK